MAADSPGDGDVLTVPDVVGDYLAPERDRRRGVLAVALCIAVGLVASVLVFKRISAGDDVPYFVPTHLPDGYEVNWSWHEGRDVPEKSLQWWNAEVWRYVQDDGGNAKETKLEVVKLWGEFDDWVRTNLDFVTHDTNRNKILRAFNDGKTTLIFDLADCGPVRIDATGMGEAEVDAFAATVGCTAGQLEWPAPPHFVLDCHNSPEDVVWQLSGGHEQGIELTASRTISCLYDLDRVDADVTVETISGRRTTIEVSTKQMASWATFSTGGLHFTFAASWPTTEDSRDDVRRILEGLRKVDRAEWERLTAAPPG